MVEVRSAIHIRTGQRAAVDTIDGWLARHQVNTVTFDDVYDACVHLLKHYELIPDLALIGSDWLADAEYQIVPYVRQTWPRTALVVYRAAGNIPLVNVLPAMLTCTGEAALDELLASTPTDVARRLCAATDPRPNVPASPAACRPPATPTVDGFDAGGRGPLSRTMGPAAPQDEQRAAVDRHRGNPDEKPALRLPEAEPRAILTAEELAALLNPGDED